MPSMPWTIEFRTDATHDVVSAHFKDCVLATPADVDRWEAETGAKLRGFNRRLDLLICLDGLVVRPAAAAAFGAARTRVLGQFSLRSYRYGGDRSTTTAVYTSSAIHGAAANVYPTRNDALAALLDDRKNGR